MAKRKPRPHILVDTREGLPYVFSDAVEVSRHGLHIGDYTLAGYEDDIAIERKTIEDFAQCSAQDHDRFVRQIERLSRLPHACIVVEANVTDIIQHRYDSGVHPNSLLGMAIAAEIDHGVPVHFLKDRIATQCWVERYLSRYFKNQQEREKVEA